MEELQCIFVRVPWFIVGWWVCQPAHHMIHDSGVANIQHVAFLMTIADPRWKHEVTDGAATGISLLA